MCAPLVRVHQWSNLQPAVTLALTFGAVVTYYCESGYSVDGTVSANNTFDLSCGELGFTEAKSCTPVKYSKPSQWLSDDGTARADVDDRFTGEVGRCATPGALRIPLPGWIFSLMGLQIPCSSWVLACVKYLAFS